MCLASWRPTWGSISWAGKREEAAEALTGRDPAQGDSGHRARRNPATPCTLSESKLKAAKITTEPAGYDQLPTELGVPGRIEVNADRRIEIRPRAPGVVREVHVVLGQ